MNQTTFEQSFFHISGEELDLRLIDTFEGKDGSLPFYWWEIVLKSENIAIGKISLRIGHNYHAYYNGHIGYEIDEPYRGRRYAFQACQMVLSVAEHHNMDRLYITCDYDNVASYKTIERLGAKLLEEVYPPEDYLYYYEGNPKKKIYELKVVQ